MVSDLLWRSRALRWVYLPIRALSLNTSSLASSGSVFAKFYSPYSSGHFEKLQSHLDARGDKQFRLRGKLSFIPNAKEMFEILWNLERWP